MKNLLALPLPALVGIGVLILVQLSLQVMAVVDIVRKPVERLTLPKAAWIAIVVLGEILGPIIYFVAGRKPAEVVDIAPATAAGTRAEAAADALYGARSEPSQR